MRLLLLGAGYSARALARSLEGTAPVSGTARSAERLPALAEAGVRGHVWTGGPPTPGLTADLARATHVLVSAPPGPDGDPFLSAIDSEPGGWDTPALRWVGYLSSTGVYGDHGGGWVDEETPCHPTLERSRRRREAEEAWRRFGEKRGAAVALLRLSGIYGPGRNALRDLEWGTAKRVDVPGVVFNRIHVEDVAGATLLLASRGQGGVYNVSDDEPAPPAEVVTYAARLMGVEPPPLLRVEDAGLSPMGLEFYRESKRVSNTRLCEEGFRLRHPDYRSGLTSLWRSGTWR